MPSYVILEEAYQAQTQKFFKIAMGNGEIKGENVQFVLKAVPEGNDEPFTFIAMMSKVILEKLGFTFSPEDLEKIAPLVGKKALIDLKRRLDGGHDYNFDGQPYIKSYTLRDKKDFDALK
jgi:hypothetical protein